MFGIILEVDWNAGGPSVNVVATSNDDDLGTDVNCGAAADSWDRRYVVRLRGISVYCLNDGTTLPAHVCRYQP